MNIFFADNGERFGNDFLYSCPNFKKYDDDDETCVDILVVDAVAAIDTFRNRKVDTCFCPSSRFYDVVNSIKVKSAVSCGMRERDSVTFSCIGEDEAMICLKRRILFLDKEFDPCEFKIHFNRSRALYTNLALGTLEYLVNNYGD